MRGIESRLRRLEGLAGQLPDRVEPLALRCTGGVHDREHPNHREFCREGVIAMARCVLIEHGTALEDTPLGPHFDPEFEALMVDREGRKAMAAARGEDPCIGPIARYVDDALADGRWEADE